MAAVSSDLPAVLLAAQFLKAAQSQPEFVYAGWSSES